MVLFRNTLSSFNMFAARPNYNNKRSVDVSRVVWFRRCLCEKPPDRVPGDDTKQSTGASQVEEGSALKRQECCSL